MSNVLPAPNTRLPVMLVKPGLDPGRRMPLLVSVPPPMLIVPAVWSVPALVKLVLEVLVSVAPLINVKVPLLMNVVG